MKQLRILLVPLVLAYLTVWGGFLAFQHYLVFVPRPLNGTTPKDFGLTEYRDVRFPSSDGVTLDAWWVRHPTPDPKRPVLLYCHGNAANLSRLSEVAKIFYDFGFDALIFDYRSYGDSQTGALNETTVDWDAFSAYNWLKSRGVPEDRIMIWGHSLGSSIAAELATKTHPAGLILEGAFPSIYAVSRVRFPWLLAFPFMITEKFATEKYVTERTCPLLELHAEKDTVIPIRLGEEVFDKAAEPKEWLFVEGIDHNDFPSVAGQYKETIMGFVGKCLKGTN